MTCYNTKCAKVPYNAIGNLYCPDWETCPNFDGIRPVIDEPYAMRKEDAVQHPSHYQGPHECIDLMQALFGKEDVMAFCRCNSFKYRFRAGKKEGAAYEQDIAKAQFYEDLLIEMRQREGL